MPEENQILNEFLLYSPEEEYLSHIHKKLEVAAKYQDNDKINLYQEALELGLQILKKIK